MKTSMLTLAALAALLAAVAGCSNTGPAPEATLPAPEATLPAPEATLPAPEATLPTPGATVVGPEKGGDGVRRSPVVAGRRARVFVMSGFGAHCESLPAPAITITQPPAKGSVSFEPGQQTTINTSKSGTCLGQTVAGTGIYYTARADQSGPDRFSIRAEIGGDVTERTFSVEIVQ